MDITPLIPKGKQIIKSYGDGGFTINEERYEGSILLLPDRVTTWPIAEFMHIEQATIQEIIDLTEEIELLLLGCGAVQEFLDPGIKRLLSQRKIPSETMDTGAACRTYNVLLAEGRQVAAALIAV